MTTNRLGSGVIIYAMNKPPYEIISWDDALDYGYKLKPYKCYDHKGKLIQINPKVKVNHQSFHPLQNHPALFLNLRQVVSDPHDITTNPKSNNPVSIENRQKGDIVVYSRKGFTGNLDFPDYPTFDSDTDEVSVTVLYNKKSGKNYTLTFGIGINYGN